MTHIGNPDECRTFVFAPLDGDVPAADDGVQPLATGEPAPGPDPAPVREEEVPVLAR